MPTSLTFATKFFLVIALAILSAFKLASAPELQNIKPEKLGNVF